MQRRLSKLITKIRTEHQQRSSPLIVLQAQSLKVQSPCAGIVKDFNNNFRTSLSEKISQ